AVEYLDRPSGVNAGQQRDVIDAVRALNQTHKQSTQDAEIETRLAQYEMAAKMQASVPSLMDFSDESQATLEQYGATPGDGSFASNCILARRMAERGVRFIQLYQRGWDHHNDLRNFMGVCTKSTDQASAALVHDLKQ